ncbi:MAG TPA: AMP-binding protein [Candidatus Sulfotelmatobacter sp.]|nr:AMP-binding protein [Candidatus Sulfotelmatobacter sp.]
MSETFPVVATENVDRVRRRLRSGSLPDELLKPGRDAVLRSGDRCLTRDDLRFQAGAVAGGLREAGIGAGDRLALYAASSIDWVIAYLGAQRAGACVVLMNPDYHAAEAGHILADSQPTAVIADRDRAEIVRGLGARVIALEDLPRAEEPAMPPLTPESPAAILYTSGTTGRPKGALLDHGNLLAQGRGAVEVWRWTSRDILVHALPLFHLHGLGMGLHGTLLSGASATFVPFAPAAVVAELTRDDAERGTMFFGVPSMYQRLCDWLDEHPTDLSHVRLFVCGSAPLPPALFERCSRLLGQAPVERYGITEGGIVVTNPYDGPRQPGRVGYPFPGVEVRLGELDEVLLKGGQVFRGYWRNPDATAEAFTSDGFFKTGDIGEIGEDGTLAIRGRLKELIITGGFNVYPREVELVLETHPAVQEVAVAGVPSEKWGEEVTAFVVPSQAAPLVESEIISFAHERLASYKCPKRVVIMDRLPRNAMGKVLRSQLPSPRQERGSFPSPRRGEGQGEG